MLIAMAQANTGEGMNPKQLTSLWILELSRGPVGPVTTHLSGLPRIFRWERTFSHLLRHPWATTLTKPEPLKTDEIGHCGWIWMSESLVL